MPPGQVEFTYSADQLNTIVLYLSAERLAMYMKAVNYAKDITDRTRKALRLYEQNTSLSEALYPVIQGFEVALRNAVNNRLCADHGNDWLETFELNESEKESIEDAKATIGNKSQVFTYDRMVAELSFGFWVRLFSSDYAETLWGPSLSKVVPIKDRRALYERLIEIKTLRNRIAHHNRIIGRTHTIEDSYNRILEAIDWISPLVCSWVMNTNSVMDRVKKRTPIVPAAQRQTSTPQQTSISQLAVVAQPLGRSDLAPNGTPSDKKIE